MHMTVAKKLGIGLGAIVLLMIVSCSIVYFSILSMHGTVEQLTKEVIPVVESCDKLNIGFSRALAALRGLVTVGDDSAAIRDVIRQRQAAWTMIGDALHTLERASRDWPEMDRQRVASITTMAADFRKTQQEIENKLQSDANIPAFKLLTQEAEPRANRLLETLTQIIDEEVRLEASTARKSFLKAVADSRGSFATCLSHIRAYLLTGDVAFRTRFENSWQTNEQAAKTCNALDLFTASQREEWDAYLTLRSEFIPTVNEMFRYREADDWNRAQYHLNTLAVPLATRLESAIAELTEAAGQVAIDSQRELSTKSVAARWTLLASTCAATATGILIAVLLSRTIVSTVQSLASRAKQVSCGDLTGESLAIRSADELGQLADSFDLMLSNLRDLTGQIHIATENVNAATTQISSSSQQQASSTREQAATVQQITSTMQEVSQSGAQIVEKAKQVAATAEATSTSRQAGMEAVQDTSQTMETIREQVEDVAINIVALSEKTQAVGEIVATVNDIAEQSNLLALNATIEAAEAGAEGNRFSVVAAEMKHLADQAKECTAQVRQILGDIQKGINSAVMLTEEAVKRVENGKQQAEISERTIRQMSANTDESLQAFQQIIGATTQQQIGFEQVSKGMQEIDVTTQQTAAATSQLEQAVLSLSSMSEQLKAAVCSYRI